MDQRNVVIGATVFVLVVGALFGYTYWKRAELNTAPSPEAQRQEESVRINVVHFYKDGSHTIVGELDMPTPCDLIEAVARVAESMPEQVTIDLHIVNTAETCAQVVTTQRFKTSFEASTQATISATLDGKPVLLNLVEGDQNLNSDEVDRELFFKW